jgi:hypothetical protein
MEEWMVDHIGPTAALKEVAAHAGELLEQLPQLPSMLISATGRLRTLERSMHRQSRELQKIEQKLAQLTRGRMMKRTSGTALLVMAGFLLFNSLNESFNHGTDLATSAGLVSAVAGALLLLRS